MKFFLLENRLLSPRIFSDQFYLVLQRKLFDFSSHRTQLFTNFFNITKINNLFYAQQASKMPIPCRSSARALDPVIPSDATSCRTRISTRCIWTPPGQKTRSSASRGKPLYLRRLRGIFTTVSPQWTHQKKSRGPTSTSCIVAIGASRTLDSPTRTTAMRRQRRTAFR